MQHEPAQLRERVNRIVAILTMAEPDQKPADE
jgi:hypothetical protein